MDSPSFDREKSVFFAELSHQTKRYQDMAREMGNVAKAAGELRADEKIWLSLGYNNVMKPLIHSWRILSSKMVEDSHSHTVIREYREKVESEMTNICRDVFDILDRHLIPSCKPEDDPTSAAFYYMMKGNYYRYLAEFVTGTHKQEAVDKGFQSYQFAMHIELPHTHPIRLGLALNFAGFHYEIIGSLESACKIAKKAYDEANFELHNLNEQPHKDSIEIMQLIPERIMQWKAKYQERQLAINLTSWLTKMYNETLNKLGINTITIHPSHRAMASSSSFPKKAVFFAMLAEETERYDDMVEEMIKLAKAVGELGAYERILLYKGCKNAIDRLKASRIILSSKMVVDSANTNRIREYREKVDAEITKICNDVVLVLDQHLIPSSKPEEDPVSTPFYYLMKGDYISCVAELKFGNDRKETADKARKAYESARSICRETLPPKHPIRMGVALNFSIFCHVILGFTDEACSIATEAYNDAIKRGFDRLNEEQLSVGIMKLLLEYIKVWKDECKEMHEIIKRAPPE